MNNKSLEVWPEGVELSFPQTSITAQLDIAEPKLFQIWRFFGYGELRVVSNRLRD
jgi:hypothetical protein